MRRKVLLGPEGLSPRGGDDLSMDQFFDGKVFSLWIDLPCPEKTIETLS
jgi:hypothetical protein